MGQILYSRNPTGTVGLGLFLIALGAFAFSLFAPLVALGALAAPFFARRRPPMPHIDPRQLDQPD